MTTTAETTVVNDTQDVSNVKGVQGGYGYSAPYGTEAFDADASPVNPFDTLPEAFDNMGFISEDGFEESIDTDTTEVKDMNGDVIFVGKSSEKENIKLTLVSLTKQSLSEWHGHSNVSEKADWLEVKHTVADHDNRVYVFDLLLKDGRRWRKIVPNGKVSDVGAVVHGSGEVAGREVTITCLPDPFGVRVYDYIQKAQASTAGGNDGGSSAGGNDGGSPEGGN